jgi:hypothetical protein
MKRAAAIAAIAVALSVGLPAAVADTLPSGTFIYVLKRNGDQIGTQSITYRSRGNRLAIQQRVEVRVRVVNMAAYTYDMNVNEFWAGQRLSQLAAMTNKNGTALRTMARLDGSQLHVTGDAGEARTGATAVPAPPVWNVLGHRPTRMFDVETGETLEVTVSEGREESVRVAGDTVACTRYEIRGGLNATVWYDADGVLAKQRYRAPDGSDVYTIRTGGG